MAKLLFALLLRDPMSKTEALVRSIELELPRTHSRVLGAIQAAFVAEIVKERMKPQPDYEKINQLRAQATKLEHAKNDFNYTLTVESILEPLRNGEFLGQ
jgi:hypothetical protein